MSFSDGKPCLEMRRASGSVLPAFGLERRRFFAGTRALYFSARGKIRGFMYNFVALYNKEGFYD